MSLTPADLRILAAPLYAGPPSFHGWQAAFARDLGVDGRTVRKWLADDRDIPPPVAAYIVHRWACRSLLMVFRAWPEIVASLPPDARGVPFKGITITAERFKADGVSEEIAERIARAAEALIAEAGFAAP